MGDFNLLACISQFLKNFPCVWWHSFFPYSKLLFHIREQKSGENKFINYVNLFLHIWEKIAVSIKQWDDDINEIYARVYYESLIFIIIESH